MGEVCSPTGHLRHFGGTVCMGRPRPPRGSCHGAAVAGGVSPGCVGDDQPRWPAGPVAGQAERLLASGDAIDASFGVTVYQPGDDRERLVGRADEALHQAKRRREESAA